jgi:hypothetical protein
MPYFQQGDLYLSSGPRPGDPNQRWNSVSCNAHHNSTNDNWAPFPDPTRGAVTIEIDANGEYYSRLEVYVAYAPQHPNDLPNWIKRLAIDETGTVFISGQIDGEAGYLNVRDNLKVAGAATFEDAVYVLRNGSFQGDLHVDGGVTGTGNGFFRGDLHVGGQIFGRLADCAEDFDVHDPQLATPGTVMVLCDDGTLAPSRQPYDKRVAGVISGGGGLAPAIVLDRQENGGYRVPVALMGKVYCRADAQYAPIEVGDLLTTSPTPGHAMKASDQARAYGATIGKALRPMAAGNGLLLILVTLQ